MNKHYDPKTDTYVKDEPKPKAMPAVREPRPKGAQKGVKSPRGEK